MVKNICSRWTPGIRERGDNKLTDQERRKDALVWLALVKPLYPEGFFKEAK